MQACWLLNMIVLLRYSLPSSLPSPNAPFCCLSVLKSGIMRQLPIQTVLPSLTAHTHPQHRLAQMPFRWTPPRRRTRLMLWVSTGGESKRIALTWMESNLGYNWGAPLARFLLVQQIVTTPEIQSAVGWGKSLKRMSWRSEIIHVPIYRMEAGYTDILILVDKNLPKNIWIYRNAY